MRIPFTFKLPLVSEAGKTIRDCTYGSTLEFPDDLHDFEATDVTFVAHFRGVEYPRKFRLTRAHLESAGGAGISFETRKGIPVHASTYEELDFENGDDGRTRVIAKRVYVA